jgi:hypothetical protein
MAGGQSKSVAVIVAHPDDETLWAGLANMERRTLSLCRKMCGREKYTFF